MVGCAETALCLVVLLRVACWVFLNTALFSACFKNGGVLFSCFASLIRCASRVCLLALCLQSILEYNGGSVLAMKGKNCVVIASDTRYGLQAQTIATDFPKTFKMTDQCYVGLVGLATDIQTMYVLSTPPLLRFSCFLWRSARGPLSVRSLRFASLRFASLASCALSTLSTLFQVSFSPRAARDGFFSCALWRSLARW
jgi:Proteasome subunit